VTGVYGVLSFAISQRTREFGIQMMLGATRGAIFKSVLARGLRQIAMGILFGLILAIPAAGSFMRMTSNGWLRVDAFDLPVYLTTGIILTAISLAAMCLPALRAMRVDPVEALRND
jgi:ABC-type antimicrobial peptide transport system permease subunit